MAPNTDANLVGKMTCAVKNDMKNLANFNQSTRKSQNWHFDGIFLSNHKMHELKIYRGVICHDKK